MVGCLATRKEGWFVTDDDCFQCCRVNMPAHMIDGKVFGEYELIQINSMYPAGTDEESFVIARGTVKLEDYTTEQMVSYLKLYGHKDMDDFIDAYDGILYYQYIAEMIFETEISSHILPGAYSDYESACSGISRITGLDESGNEIKK